MPIFIGAFRQRSRQRRDVALAEGSGQQVTGMLQDVGRDGAQQHDALYLVDSHLIRDAHTPAYRLRSHRKMITELHPAPIDRQFLRARHKRIRSDRRRGAPSAVMKIRKDTPRIWRIFSADDGDASALKRVSYLRAMPKTRVRCVAPL